MWRDLLSFYVREFPGRKWLIGGMSLLAALSHGMLLSVLNAAIDSRAAGTFDILLPAAFIGCLAVYLLGSYFAMYQATAATGLFLHNLRNRMCEKIRRASLRTLEKYGNGAVYTHLTSDVEKLAFAGRYAIRAAQALVLLLFIVGYVAWLSPLGVVVMVIAIFGGVAAYLAQEARAKVDLRRAREEEERYFGLLEGLLLGQKEVKLNRRRGDGLAAHLVAVSDAFRHGFVHSELMFFIGFLSSQVFLFAVIGLVVFLPAGWLVDDAAIYFKLVVAMLYAINPIEELVDFVGPATRARVALDNLQRLDADLEATVEQNGDSRAAGPAHDPWIALEGVEMHYGNPGEGFSLGPVDFALREGEIVFIVGGNGSGKTTFLKLLTGLYRPDQGLVRFNGEPVEAANRATYRDQFSAMFYDFHLFKRLYGLDAEAAATDGRPWLKRFGLAGHTDIRDGALTRIDLSTGQRKRLALATLLIEHRPILVCDEFAADQDPEFRRFFYRELLPGLREAGHTIVAVTHDDAFFDCCDRAIKMDYGCIVPFTPGASG